MQPFLAVFAVLLCVLYGLRASTHVKEEARRLARWAELLPRLSLLIAEETRSLPEAMRLAADEPHPPDRLLHAVADAVCTDPLLSLAEAFARHCPPCTEHETLMRMHERLGRGSAESRRLAVEQAAAALAQMSANVKDRAARDARLYATLGFTGGACLAILLL